VALRLIAAAFTPITFDEAYYWIGEASRRRYYDHPLRRGGDPAGTLIAGDTDSA